jgi:hypothetical protein
MKNFVNGGDNVWGAPAARGLSLPARQRLRFTIFFVSHDFQDGMAKCSAGRRTLHAGGVRSPSPMEVRK